MYDIYDLPKSIPLGRQGEQYARAVEIDCAKMLRDYPGARLTLMQRRTRGETARIVKTDVSDTGVITWSPDMDAMAVAGLGAIEIVATVDDKVAKSVIAATAIAPSLTPPDTNTQSGWVKDVLDASDAAQGAMVAAQESAAAAAGSAAAAQSSANAAAGSASAASGSATSAAESADAASGSASAAAQSAAEADASAKASAASAAEAAGTLDSVKASEDAAAASARAAAESASDAAGSKSNAAQSATDAAQAASAAAGSANQSAAARDAAQAAQTAAAQSASDAADSATAASGSKDAAAQSASKAAASAAAAEKAAQDAMEIIDDDVIAEDSTWSSKQITDQNYTHFTVSGNPAVCEDVLEGYPLELNASWEPKQEGSGTPSPDNVRPITGGRDSVTFTRAEDGASRVVTLGETVYSGNVKINNRKIVKTRATITLTGNEPSHIYTDIFYLDGGYLGGDRTNGISSHYQYLTYGKGKIGVTGGDNNASVVYTPVNDYIADYTGLEAWKAYLASQYAAGTPVQICYELETPKEIEVESANDLPALAGTNTISTDADTLKVGGVKPLRKPIDDTRVGTDNVWSAKHTADTLLPIQTVTGNPAVIETLEGYPLELSASWELKQEGSGTPSPDNVRPITGTKLVTLRESNANLLNPADIVNQTFAPYNLQIKLVDKSTLRIKGTWQESETRSFVVMELNNKLLSGRGLKIADTVTNGTPLAHTLYGLRTRDETAIALATAEGGWPPGTAVDMTIKVGVYAPEAVPAEYQPYAGKQFLLTLPRAIYGGIIDTITGQGKETWGYIASYAGETLPGEWISDRDEYAAGATPTVGAQVAYKLATPVPFTATGGQTALALAGTNVVITDADTLTATAPTPPQTTASAAEAQAAKLDYIAMMADVDMDDLLAVDDAGADAGMDMDMPTDIDGSETDGEQEV